MNIDNLLKRYFDDDNQLPIIEVFDNENIHTVYKDIVNVLKIQPDIELGILQTLSYCFYEILDNVLTHSKKSCGTVVLRYIPEKTKIQIMVVDDGIGIKRSLSENEAYKDISEPQHRAALEAAFALKEEYGYKELEDTLIKTYLAEGVRLNHQNAVALITMLRNKRMIVQENGRKYSFKPDYHY